MRARLVLSLLIPFHSVLWAQTEQQKIITRDDLPPSAVIANSLGSFDRIRADMANWSDVELAAFQAVTTQAKADCARIEQTPHEGEEALALARLCALGRDWDGTYSAARWYTRKSAPAAEAQHLPTGFALLLQADLNLQAVQRAVDELQEMQSRLPFTADTDSIFQYAIQAMEVTRPEYGLQAARLRQPALLEAVSGRNVTLSPGAAEAEAWHMLSLLHAAQLGTDESAEKAKLTAAIADRAQPLSVSDQYAAEHARTQYEWIGKQAPAWKSVRSTYPAAPRRQAALAKAALWVIESADGADVPALSLQADSARGRLGPTVPVELVLTGDAPSAANRSGPRGAAIHAQYTAERLLELFAVQTGPLFVVMDANGRITWLSIGTPAWLNPQQQAEVLLERAAGPPLSGK